jgi:hypothetical protein
MFASVREMLTRDFKLVDAERNYSNYSVDISDLTNWIVYEDKNLRPSGPPGIYRVHFGINHPQYGSNISFRYFWDRVTPEIIDSDPMRNALVQTYQMLKPVKATDMAMTLLNIESLLEST